MRRGFKKTIKKFIVTVIAMVLAISIFSGLINDTNAAGTGRITLSVSSPSWFNQSVNLNWSVTDKDTIYRVTRSQDGKEYEPLGKYNGIMPMERNKSITVLPVVPSDADYKTANFLQNWIKEQNHGIKVLTAQYLSDTAFNKDADWYLKGDGYTASSPYVVDVLFFGAWDANGNKDLSKDAYEKVVKFIDAGGAVIFAHDTIALGDDPDNYKVNDKIQYSHFWQLANYNIAKGLGSATTTYKESLLAPDSTYYIANKNSNGARLQSNESNRIKMLKTGLLTSYPFNLTSKDAEYQEYIRVHGHAYVDDNNVMEIATSHNVGQRIPDNQLSDRWFEFTDIKGYNKATNNSYTNFFLTTKRNIGMIQTGHSTSSGTLEIDTAEVALLANTIHYLGLHTSTSSYEDNTATDKTGPSISEQVISSENENLKLKVNAVDRGTTYTYKIDKYYKDADVLNYQPLSTGTGSATIDPSGLEACYFAIDENAAADNNTNFEKSSELSNKGSAEFDIKIKSSSQYLHIKAVDKKGNYTIYDYEIGKDSTSPIIKIGEQTMDDTNSIDEADIKKMVVSDGSTIEKEWATGVAGYALSQNDKVPNSDKFVTDVETIDFHQFGSGYKYLWVKDNAGNYSKTKIYIHSDLIFKDSKGNEYEINKVEFNGQEMDQYYFGSDKNIFF